MGLENLKRGIEKSARILALTGVAALGSPEHPAESAELPSVSWEATVTQMHQLAVNESNEFRGIVAVGTDGTIRLSPLKEGTDLTSDTKSSEVLAFTREASKDMRIKSLGLAHTHPLSDMKYYTELPKPTWQKEPLIPPSDTDVGLKSTGDLSKEFAKAGTLAKGVCLSVFDPSGGIWYYEHKPVNELHTEREHAREHEEVLADQLETNIAKFRSDFDNRPTWKSADLNHIASLLPPEEQAMLHAPENVTKEFGTLVRNVVDRYLKKQIENGGNPNDPIVALIAPAEGWRQDYANLIKEARLSRTFREEKARAVDSMRRFAGASVSASFDFTREYAELQKAYELLNAKVRYVTIEGAVKEGPCAGVDVPATKVAAR